MRREESGVGNEECGYTMRVGILQVWLSYDEGCLKVAVSCV